MSERYIPEKGDIIWLQMNPQAGHEQAGRRPALVLTPSNYNGITSLAIICPITNQKKGYPFEVDIPDGLDVTGVILSDQLKSLDWRARRAEFKCEIDSQTLLDVLAKIKALIQVS